MFGTLSVRPVQRFLVTVGLVASAFVGAAHPVAAQSMLDEDIVDTAIAAGDFTTLTTALGAAGLVDTLRGPGPFTVFAPTDEAFAKLPVGTVQMLLDNPAMLRAILTYHVVAGEVSALDVMSLMSATTVQGEDVAVSIEDGMVMINDSMVILADVMTSNGVIHVVDTVLLPPSLA